MTDSYTYAPAERIKISERTADDFTRVSVKAFAGIFAFGLPIVFLLLLPGDLAWQYSLLANLPGNWNMPPLASFLVTVIVATPMLRLPVELARLFLFMYEGVWPRVEYISHNLGRRRGQMYWAAMVSDSVLTRRQLLTMHIVPHLVTAIVMMVFPVLFGGIVAVLLAGAYNVINVHTLLDKSPMIRWTRFQPPGTLYREDVPGTVEAVRPDNQEAE